ncbi:hypothetical protein [Allosphingosinicella vermicomposti]|uniref:hypothetical protein n=1 Tax=Allosphingosinicella vermicomposti TaxID=614671 RepID=UPI00131A57A3|nr:hypothetical protein [Allosphingosinicella vermicomposti]
MLFAAISALLAVQTPPPASDDIVVTGQRLTADSARRYVTEITRPVDGQLPRFRQPVCPAVIGLPDEHAAALVARVRKVASHVRIPVAPEGCGANLRVIVVDDAPQFMSELKRQKPEFFAGMLNADVDRLMADQGPVRAWTVTQVQNEDGHVFAATKSGQSVFDRASKDRVSSGDEPAGSASNMPRPDGGSGTMRIRSASIIKETTLQAMLDSYVVIESGAVTGKSTTQLADYVTMRAIGGAIPPGKDMVVDTILTLFEDARETPISLRASDLAYLKSLYSGSGTMRGAQQLNRITKAVLKTSPSQGE